MKSDQINELASALSKAQGQIKGAIKDTSNPFFKSKYADLASVWDACREPLSGNGLSVMQTTIGDDPTKVTVVTTLAHTSGQWIQGQLTLMPAKADPQGIGSAITYARRYALAAIVGVAPDDDDGNAASGKSDAPETVKIPPKVVSQVIEQSLACIEKNDELGLKQIWADFDADQKVVLWGKFNSQQRATMKELMK